MSSIQFTKIKIIKQKILRKAKKCHFRRIFSEWTQPKDKLWAFLTTQRPHSFWDTLFSKHFTFVCGSYGVRNDIKTIKNHDTGHDMG